ncbi:FAD-dependent 5-carboxymethylaminomethyl-2-thiouridine(34) oxidoreductase MnmC [Leptospira sp. 96542]|nr:FAD-dependent 5-carboxymethylaminomethyl-2-thiouridine(34) oxidoreductase MnmC [Leptospira sp. 96542]
MAELVMIDGKSALIVGAGIAGAATAFSLSKRGVNITVLDSQKKIALGASGNPAGVVYPFLTKHKTNESIFSIEAFRFFLETWEKENLKNFVPYSNGVYHLINTDEDFIRYSNAIESHSLEYSNIARLTEEPITNKNAIYFPLGKTISPVDFVKSLLDISGAKLILNTDYLQWEESGGSIRIRTNQQEFTTDFLVFSNGSELFDDEKLSWLPFKKVRGQILQLPDIKIQNAILYGDYITANLKDGSILGASYDEYKLDPSTRINESEALLLNLSKTINLHQMGIENISTFLKSHFTRVSFRNQTEDRSPVVGLLPNKSLFIQNNLRKKGENKKFEEIPYYNSVGILNGLGSRGLTHALISAEILARQLLKERPLLEEKIENSIKPDRFLIRMWKQDRLKL